MTTQTFVVNMEKQKSKNGGKVEYTYQEASDQKWVRSREGWFAGVCQGLGESFGIDAWFLRFAWVLSILFFGFGLMVYLGLALTLPVAGQSASESERDRVLGVCRRLHKKLGIEIGLVRFIALTSVVSSLGVTLLAYFVLHFVLDEEEAS